MRLDVLTLFPEIFSGYLGQGLLKRAIERKLVEVRLHNIRDWSADAKHKKVDDRPFGGGPGMVVMVEPVVACVEAVRAEQADPGHLVMLSPQGRRLDQAVVEELAACQRVLLLCGRYEGFDERVRLILKPDEISLGDFVLNGGEVAAMAVIDAVMRLVPGVLGDEQSSREDSFSGENRWLEFAQYTRPREFRGLEVPPILLSGNHEEIARWRKQNALLRTRDRRPDLIDGQRGPAGAENETRQKGIPHEPASDEPGREDQHETRSSEVRDR
ncbi:MAG: tRNA (guanosine(37)-N1)-methyltransferase TrmD [Pirellulales bacterium]|nr:tRNA (guanosine(37)-N1)-methyltransferase TrmD [Pirellulales bacterium]